MNVKKSQKFRFRDDIYVLEIVKSPPVLKGSWGVRLADDDQYITVRRDAREAIEDALGDIQDLDAALNQGFEELFGTDRNQG
ncbi:hypothetical protein [Streptomyces tubercidicus]|uniref:hypothetical protein n=1 Tax=Streptomyces tubercidicus TaxID=47759 RepID=UPI0036B6F060